MTDSRRRIHDYTRRYFGHDFTVSPHADPVTADITGWGHGLRKQDFLLIPRPGGGRCIYEIETLRYTLDPADMWFTGCRFVLGSSELGARIKAVIEASPVTGRPPFGRLGAWWVLEQCTDPANNKTQEPPQ